MTEPTAHRPTEDQIEQAIEANAEQLAQELNDGLPGATRVSILLPAADSPRIRVDNHNATPLPSLAVDEIYLWTLADGRHYWAEDVLRQGTELFERREGPADPTSS